MTRFKSVTLDTVLVTMALASPFATSVHAQTRVRDGYGMDIKSLTSTLTMTQTTGRLDPKNNYLVYGNGSAEEIAGYAEEGNKLRILTRTDYQISIPLGERTLEIWKELNAGKSLDISACRKIVSAKHVGYSIGKNGGNIECPVYRNVFEFKCTKGDAEKVKTVDVSEGNYREMRLVQSRLTEDAREDGAISCRRAEKFIR